MPANAISLGVSDVKRYVIYALRDPRNGNIRYVGITKQPVRKRLSSHLAAARNGKPLHISAWIRQLSKEGLQPLAEVLEETSDTGREAVWTAQFRGEGCDLTNLTGGGVSGYCHTPEVREKIALAGEGHFKDLSGQKIGRLTVLEIAEHRPLRWRCACDCGKIALIAAQSFSARRVESCGCLARELAAERTRNRARHGMWRSKEYLTWIEMRARCNNPKHVRYGCNGALGVRVCARWKAAFEPFLADMGAKPEGRVLMRKDVRLDYGPENCVWATRSKLRKQI